MAIKLITREEMNALPLVPNGRKHPIRALLLAMQPGQIIRIGREDFKWKGKTPAIFCSQIEKATKAKFKVLKEGKVGWVIERLE
jgi:hypothetical protein